MAGVVDVLIFVLLVLLCVAMAFVVVMFMWVLYDATDFGECIKQISGWVKKRRMERESDRPE